MEQGAAFRLGVGLVIINQKNQALWARRVDMADAWQFPQGGIESGESELEAMYRELFEEVGLEPQDVEVLSHTHRWYQYELPHSRQEIAGKKCLGQKQKWFLLKLLAEDTAISLSRVVPAEFDKWKWVEFWYPLDHIVAFKQQVYRGVLTEFARFLEISEDA